MQGNAFQNAAGKLYRRGIAVITWVEANHFIAGANQGADRSEQRFGCTRSDGHFTIGIGLPAVELSGFFRNGLTQRRCASHRCVLVCPLADVPAQALF
ncbi:hypothetical protein D3C71_1968250 [compost metagenome]